MKAFILCTLYIALLLVATASNARNSVTSVTILQQTTIETLDQVWSRVSDYKFLQPDIAVTRILRRLYHLRHSIQNFEKSLSNFGGLNDLSRLHATLSRSPNRRDRKWIDAWSYMEGRVGPINSLFYSLEKLQNQSLNSTLTTRALLDYAETIHDDTGLSTEDLLKNLHYITRNKDGVFRQFHHVYQKQSMCSLHQSPHQLLYNLYNFIALTEIKGYTMMHFAWMTLQLHEKGNYSTEIELARNALLERSLQKKETAGEVLKTLTTEYWKCDPSKQVEDSTFLQVTELLQGYIENEVDMNKQRTCRENCGYYNYAEHTGCYKGLCMQQRQCKGKIVNCQFIDADATVCLSDANHRRYDWIEYENGRNLGDKGSCSNSLKVDSWWRWVFWHCSFCFCVCDEAGTNSDRYFDLRNVLSDISQNKIVTGVRFTKKTRFFTIQIQQGVALQTGGINESTLSWKPVEDMNIESEYVVDGKDYAKLSFEKRGMDLDDITGPEGTVVTGIRLRELGSNLNLEVQFTPIDSKTGKLNPAHSHWKSNDQTPASENDAREKLSLSNLDVPTNAVVPSMPDSINGQYLEFTHTSLNKDAAQTTVPFLDAQNVVVTPPSWLNGIGIYHKGQTGYGGYLGLKIFTQNYSSVLESSDITDFPDLSTLIDQSEDTTLAPFLIPVTAPANRSSKENEVL